MQLCEVGCIRQVIAEELEKSSCDICICAAFSTPTQSLSQSFFKTQNNFSSCSCNKPVTLSFITAPKHTNDQLICFQYLEKHPGGLSSRNVKLFMFQVMAITMFPILMINNQSSLVTVIPIPIYFCEGQHLLSLLEFHQLQQHCVTRLYPIWPVMYLRISVQIRVRAR